MFVKKRHWNFSLIILILLLSSFAVKDTRQAAQSKSAAYSFIDAEFPDGASLGLAAYTLQPAD